LMSGSYIVGSDYRPCGPCRSRENEPPSATAGWHRSRCRAGCRAARMPRSSPRPMMWRPHLLQSNSIIRRPVLATLDGEMAPGGPSRRGPRPRPAASPIVVHSVSGPPRRSARRSAATLHHPLLRNPSNIFGIKNFCKFFHAGTRPTEPWDPLLFTTRYTGFR
jgi:hypothetical protein